MSTNLSNAEVTARIIFDGLMLMCINKRHQSEVGFIRCPVHKPRILVQTHRGGRTEEDPIPLKSDLYVQVEKPLNPGVMIRVNNDDFGFRFVPDLEGRALHGGKVTVETGKLRGRMAVSAGVLYSHGLHQEEHDLVEWSTNPNGTILRRFDHKIVDGIGLNIVCRDESGSGIAIIDTGTGRTLKWLPHGLPQTTYTIMVNNDCDVDVNLAMRQPNPNGTDFRLYYNVVTARDGRRFDFKKVDAGAPSPHVCEGAFLSQTDSLGFSFDQTSTKG